MKKTLKIILYIVLALIAIIIVMRLSPKHTDNKPDAPKPAETVPFYPCDPKKEKCA